MNTIEIGKRIKEIRIEHKLSQKEMGTILAVSQDTISLWEKGKSVPTAEYLIAIAQHFQVTTDYLLCLTDY